MQPHLLCLGLLSIGFITLCCTNIGGTESAEPLRAVRQSPFDKEVVLHIKDSEKLQYHEQNFESMAYVFGYEVGPNEQFHHENIGPDGVTYGCYGFINPDGKLQATHYVSDRLGYRTVKPGNPTEISYRALDSKNDEREEESTQNDHHEQHGVLTPWESLYFPKGCGKGNHAHFREASLAQNPGNYFQVSNLGKIGAAGQPGHPEIPGNPGKLGRLGQPGNLDEQGTIEQPESTGQTESSGLIDQPRYPSILGQPGLRETLGYPGSADVHPYPLTYQSELASFGSLGAQEHHENRSTVASSYVTYSGSMGQPGALGSSNNVSGQLGSPGLIEQSGDLSIPGRPRLPGTPIIHSYQGYSGLLGQSRNTGSLGHVSGQTEPIASIGEPGFIGFSDQLGLPGVPGNRGMSGFSSSLVAPAYPSKPASSSSSNILEQHGHPHAIVTSARGSSGTIIQSETKGSLGMIKVETGSLGFGQPGYPGIPVRLDLPGTPGYPGLSEVQSSMAASTFSRVLASSGSAGAKDQAEYPTEIVTSNPGYTGKITQSGTSGNVSGQEGSKESIAHLDFLDTPDRPGLLGSPGYPGSTDSPSPTVTPTIPSIPASSFSLDAPGKPGYSIPIASSQSGYPGTITRSDISWLSGSIKGQPGSTGLMGVPRFPNISGLPEGPGYPGSSKSPSYLTKPSYSSQPGAFGTLVRPDISVAPSIPGKPRYPETPSYSEDLQYPESAVINTQLPHPGLQGHREASSQSKTSGSSEYPGLGSSIGQPENPGSPTRPSTPGLSDTQELPGPSGVTGSQYFLSTVLPSRPILKDSQGYLDALKIPGHIGTSDQHAFMFGSSQFASSGAPRSSGVPPSLGTSGLLKYSGTSGDLQYSRFLVLANKTVIEDSQKDPDLLSLPITYVSSTQPKSLFDTSPLGYPGAIGSPSDPGVVGLPETSAVTGHTSSTVSKNSAFSGALYIPWPIGSEIYPGKPEITGRIGPPGIQGKSGILGTSESFEVSTPQYLKSAEISSRLKQTTAPDSSNTSSQSLQPGYSGYIKSPDAPGIPGTFSSSGIVASQNARFQSNPSYSSSYGYSALLDQSGSLEASSYPILIPLVNKPGHSESLSSPGNHSQLEIQGSQYSGSPSATNKPIIVGSEQPIFSTSTALPGLFGSPGIAGKSGAPKRPELPGYFEKKTASTDSNNLRQPEYLGSITGGYSNVPKPKYPIVPENPGSVKYADSEMLVFGTRQSDVPGAPGALGYPGRSRTQYLMGAPFHQFYPSSQGYPTFPGVQEYPEYPSSQGNAGSPGQLGPPSTEIGFPGYLDVSGKPVSGAARYAGSFEFQEKYLSESSNQPSKSAYPNQPGTAFEPKTPDVTYPIQNSRPNPSGYIRQSKVIHQTSEPGSIGYPGTLGSLTSPGTLDLPGQAVISHDSQLISSYPIYPSYASQCSPSFNFSSHSDDIVPSECSHYTVEAVPSYPSGESRKASLLGSHPSFLIPGIIKASQESEYHSESILQKPSVVPTHDDQHSPGGMASVKAEYSQQPPFISSTTMKPIGIGIVETKESLSSYKANIEESIYVTNVHATTVDSDISKPSITAISSTIDEMTALPQEISLLYPLVMVKPDISTYRSPVNVIAYPTPAHSGFSCLCYLVKPLNNSSEITPKFMRFLPPGSSIGYLPVVFYPNCGNETGNAEFAHQIYSSAIIKPYQCKSCNEKDPENKTTKNN